MNILGPCPPRLSGLVECTRILISKKLYKSGAQLWVLLNNTLQRPHPQILTGSARDPKISSITNFKAFLCVSKLRIATFKFACDA